MQSQIGDYKESDYIEADSESHCAELHSELFCVTGNDSGFIEKDSIFDDDNMAM